jgi:flagellar biosynthesis protein FlhG
MSSNAMPKDNLANNKQHNVIAIASGKGGVGKTWLATNLVQMLARKDKKVLLFDGDLGLANVDIQLGIMTKRDLSSVIAGQVTMAQAVHHFKEGRFDIIAGRSGSGSFANLPLARVTELRHELYELAASYDKVILDLGAGLDRTMRLLSAYAGTYIVVTNAEPTALTDAYAFIKTTWYEDPSANIKIVINIANHYEEGEKTYQTLAKACKEFLKQTPPLLGVVRRDKHVSECIRTQSSIVVRYPGSPASIDVRNISNKIS